MIDFDREEFVRELANAPFDTLALGAIDLSSGKTQFEYFNCSAEDWFDLASLTKALTLGLYGIRHPEKIVGDKALLLEHRGGLPAWGFLPGKGWEEKLKSFQVTDSQTIYSDYSFLRLMLELEKEEKATLEQLCAEHLDDHLKFWTQLDRTNNCVSTGYDGSTLLKGIVHDPRARLIGRPCSHAGLFGTIEGLARALTGIWERYDLITYFEKYWPNSDNRFVRGFDRVSSPEKTLAGPGCSQKTIGHLGFTGTSFWLDLESKRVAILLSNATQNYWYQRAELHRMRRAWGSLVWR